jgi:hypothetical protein
MIQNLLRRLCTWTFTKVQVHLRVMLPDLTEEDARA